MNEMKGKVILGVAAHPDDLDFGASGTIAKWIKEGASCYYLICTDGSKGSDDPEMTEEELIKIRQTEQEEAGKILGLKGIFFLKHKDTELVADRNLKRDITKYIRMVKPDIVITFDPTMFYSTTRGYVNHTDHRAVGQAAMDAVYPLARDRLTFRELENEGHTAHKTRLLYLMNFDNATEIIDITSTIELKLKALAAHASQITEESLKRTRVRASELGKKFGYKFAEGFIKLELR